MISAADIIDFLRSQLPAVPTRPRETPLNPAPEYSEDAAAGAARLAEGFVPDNSDIPMPPPAPPPLPSRTRPLTVAAPQAPEPATEAAATPSPTLTPGVAATAQPRSPFELAPSDANALERLAAFGAALASTRSPTFQGAFGEGVQALMRQRQQQTQEARQQQQVDVEQEYRRALIANQQAELAEQRNPDNPLYQLRRAQTAAALAEVELRRRQAANVGQGGSRARLTGQIVGEDGVLYGVTREGQIEPYMTPDGQPFRRQQADTMQGRLYQDYLNRRAQAASEAAKQPTPEMQRRAFEFWNQTNPAPPNPYAGRQPQAPVAPTEPQGGRAPDRVIQLNR